MTEKIENRVFKRGEIYIADLEPHTGSEQGGVRPVLVLQNDIANSVSPTLIVAPISSKVSKKPSLPSHCILFMAEGLDMLSVALLEQIKTIDKKRIIRYVTSIGSEQMKEVEKCMLSSLGVRDIMWKSKCSGCAYLKA